MLGAQFFEDIAGIADKYGAGTGCVVVLGARHGATGEMCLGLGEQLLADAGMEHLAEEGFRVLDQLVVVTLGDNVGGVIITKFETEKDCGTAQGAAGAAQAAEPTAEAGSESFADIMSYAEILAVGADYALTAVVAAIEEFNSFHGFG